MHGRKQGNPTFVGTIADPQILRSEIRSSGDSRLELLNPADHGRDFLPKGSLALDAGHRSPFDVFPVAAARSWPHGAPTGIGPALVMRSALRSGMNRPRLRTLPVQPTLQAPLAELDRTAWLLHRTEGHAEAQVDATEPGREPAAGRRAAEPGREEPAASSERSFNLPRINVAWSIFEAQPGRSTHSVSRIGPGGGSSRSPAHGQISLSRKMSQGQAFLGSVHVWSQFSHQVVGNWSSVARPGWRLPEHR